MRLVVRVCLFVMLATGVAVAGPLDKPAFTATPAELLAEGGAATATGQGVAVLLDDVTYTFDARGRRAARFRTVFSVRTPAGADDWGTIHLDWRPFHQDQPTLRARVIDPDGSVTELDPSLQHHAPMVEESPAVFSDRRALSAPLPRLAVGAVVEQEYTIVDREPLLAAGTVRWLRLQRDVPIARVRVVISAPTALRAKIVLRGPRTAWKPTTRKVGDRTIVSYDLANVAPAADHDRAAPVDWIGASALGIATGTSWAAIATDYRAIVEATLAAPVDLPPELLAATPRATVDRVLAWLHGRVRYTGIELSQSAIVPSAPAVTLARGFGDNKDQATLLVALLRAAKIPADLALLSTGPGFDVDAALPGLGEFDHAIVRARIGGRDLWIDATEDLLPAGQLPPRDQGRRALIIGTGTKALTTTPVGAPVDNLIREVRTYHLSEHGPATVTEVSEERGIWSDNLRGFVRNTTKDEVAKSLTTYARKEYLGTYRSHRNTAAGDLATPFVFTMEIDGVERSGSSREEVTAVLFPSDTLDRLPPTIVERDAATEAAVAARTVDHLWSAPHVYEIVNRLEVPTGYTPPELPSSETRALGTMTLTTTRSHTANVYTVTYRLDTGARQITADQLRATRAAVLALSDADGDRVTATLEGTRLARLGKVREAIASIQALVALHPQEALHHLQLATRYQQLGFGEAARREAKLATTLEPKNSDAWAVLGFMLARDLSGQNGSVGTDRAGALAALRKAIALHPKHFGARKELVRVLSIDARGWMSSDRAEHRESATLLRALRAEKSLDDDGAMSLFALAMSVDRAGLEALAQELPDGATRRAAEVLAAALISADEARRVATARAGSQGGDALLVTTVSTLTTMGRYDDARALARTLPSFPAARRAALDRLAPIDVARLPAHEPTTPVIRMLQRMALGEITKPPWSAATDAALAEHAPALARTWPATVTLDSAIAGASIVSRGDAKAGWTVTVTFGRAPHTLYVALRGQRAYLIGGPQLLAGVGHEVHDLLGRGDLAGARSLLKRTIDDPALSPQSDAAQMLRRHRAALATAPRPLLEVLGWAVLGPSAPLQAVPRLRACADLPAQEDRFDCLTLGSFIAGHHHDWASATELARSALAISPDLPTTIAALASMAAFARNGSAAAEAALAAALVRHPGHRELLRAQAEAALATSWTAAAPRFDQLVADPNAERWHLNDAAWTHLFHDASPEIARALIERAVQGVSDPPRGQRNTYAAVLAEAGELAAAWAQLAPAMRTDAPIRDADWYVLGRIAEQAGLRDDAVAMYRRLKRDAEPPGTPSSWDFAQKRLKAMGVAP